MAKRKRREPYRSGYCVYGNHQKPCKGEFQNGSLVVPQVTLCACECHGDYEARLAAAGQTPREHVIEEDEDEPTEA